MLTQTEDKYCIFMLEPEGVFVVGKNGSHETSLSNALTFNDKYDAVCYVERHGIQKISTIRKVKKQNISHKICSKEWRK